MPILWKHFSITEILWRTFWRNIDDPLLTLWIYCTIQTNKNSYFSWAALLVCWYSTLWLVEKAVNIAYFCCNIVLADCCTLVHLWNSIDVFNLTSWLFFESSKLREEKKNPPLKRADTSLLINHILCGGLNSQCTKIRSEEFLTGDIFLTLKNPGEGKGNLSIGQGIPYQWCTFLTFKYPCWFTVWTLLYAVWKFFW